MVLEWSSLTEVNDRAENDKMDMYKQGITLFRTSPRFVRVCGISLLKTLWEKKKLLVTSNFFFSHSVFYPFEELSAIFTKLKIVVCKLFQF